MNKRKRNVIIALAVLLVICVFIAVEKVITRNIETVNDIDKVITSFDPTTFTKLNIFRDDVYLDLELRDGQWYDSEDEKFPIDNDAVMEMLGALNEMHACFLIEGVKNLDPYGLGYPSGSLTATAANGDTTYIGLGAYSALDENRYVNVKDGLVYMVEEDPLKYMSTNRDDYIDHFKIPAFDKVTSITVTGDRPLKAVYDPDGVYDYSGRYNYYDTLGGGHIPLNDTAVESLSMLMTRLNLKLYASYNAEGAELEKYGLDKPMRTIKVDGTDVDGNPVGYTINLGIVKGAGQPDDFGVAGDAYFAQFEGSKVVYSLSELNYITLNGVSRGGLRPQEVFAPNWTDVDSVSFTLEGVTYNMTRKLAPEEMQPVKGENDEEEPEPLYLWYLDGREFDATNIFKQMRNLFVKTYDDRAKRGGEQEYSITLRLVNNRYSNVTVNVSRADGTYCTVTRDYEVLGYATRVQTTSLREALLAAVLG